jgi:hypothetical protein
MMQQVSGTFDGTGADLYICLGFIPDWVKIRTLETTDEEIVEWNKNMRSAEAFGGFDTDDDGAIAPITHGVGIAEYRGGDLVSSASTVYLQRRADEDLRDAGTGDVISSWTLDTPANRTGHVNAGVNTTHVGEGSLICIGNEAKGDGEWAVIQAMTNDGDATDELTLSKALGSGQVLALRGMYDFIGVPAGTVTKAGFFIDSTASVNTDNELLMFEAGTFN